MTGIEIFLEVLHAAGVHVIAGNPGTTELPLNAALVHDRRFQYYFGLQEIPLMGVADGYSMATGRPAVVNLHVTCGLGHAMGMLYNAWIEGTPLLITAGQQDRRLRLSEPVIEGDTVRMAQPWTKWAYEVQRVEDVAPAVRRALQIALTPPRGPVFLSLPLDLQSEQLASPCDLSPPYFIHPQVRPPESLIREAAAMLFHAQAPVILAGSRVTESGGCDALATLAELLGAPIFSESTPSHGRLPVRADHPCYRGPLPMWSPDLHACLQEYDLALAVGLNLLRLYIYRQPDRPLPENLRLIHLDVDAREIGKNYPPQLGVWCDISTGLEELARCLRDMGAPRPSAQARFEQYARLRVQEMQECYQTPAECARGALTASEMMRCLGHSLPANVAVVEEAITSHRNLWERWGLLRDPYGFFAQRGWGLGWGLGCALGVKVAWPHRPVLALLGDGAALYGIQGLWTAAHHRIPVVFVIANNRQYRILRVCGEQLGLAAVQSISCPGLDLTEPQVDFVNLARCFGVDAIRTNDSESLCEAIREAWKRDTPLLVEVPLWE